MSENCVRHLVEIDDENYYIILGKDFVMATVPRENDPQMSKTRDAVDKVCSAITELMKVKV